MNTNILLVILMFVALLAIFYTKERYDDEVEVEDDELKETPSAAPISITKETPSAAPISITKETPSAAPISITPAPNRQPSYPPPMQTITPTGATGATGTGTRGFEFTDQEAVDQEAVAGAGEPKSKKSISTSESESCIPTRKGQPTPGCVTSMNKKTGKVNSVICTAVRVGKTCCYNGESVDASRCDAPTGKGTVVSTGVRDETAAAPEAPVAPASFLQNQSLEAATSDATRGWTYCLDVPNSKKTAYSPLNVFGCNAKDNQIWTYDPSTKSIKNKNSGLCLSISGTATDSNPGVGQDTCNGSANQQWAYDEATRTITSPYISGACLDVSGGKINNRTRIGMYKCVGSVNQTWYPVDPTSVKDVNQTKASTSGGMWF